MMLRIKITFLLILTVVLVSCAGGAGSMLTKGEVVSKLKSASIACEGVNTNAGGLIESLGEPADVLSCDTDGGGEIYIMVYQEKEGFKKDLDQVCSAPPAANFLGWEPDVYAWGANWMGWTSGSIIGEQDIAKALGGKTQALPDKCK